MVTALGFRLDLRSGDLGAAGSRRDSAPHPFPPSG